MTFNHAVLVRLWEPEQLRWDPANANTPAPAAGHAADDSSQRDYLFLSPFPFDLAGQVP